MPSSFSSPSQPQFRWHEVLRVQSLNIHHPSPHPLPPSSPVLWANVSGLSSLVVYYYNTVAMLIFQSVLLVFRLLANSVKSVMTSMMLLLCISYDIIWGLSTVWQRKHSEWGPHWLCKMNYPLYMLEMRIMPGIVERNSDRVCVEPLVKSQIT